MRGLVFIILTCVGSVAFAQSGALLQKVIELPANSGTLSFFLDVLEKQGVSLAYNSQQLRLDKPITLTGKKHTVEQLMRLILEGEDMETAVVNNKLVIYRDAKKPLSINGTVYAANSKETLPYATIRVLGTSQIAICNAFGFYSLLLPPGNYVLQASFVGYKAQTDSIKLAYSKTINFKLAEANNLESVEIREKSDDLLAGKSIESNKAYQLPLLLGEADPLKLLSFNAGVVGNNLSVRGGSSDQNLVLLDGAPVFYHNHFLGLLSIFNNDALKKIDFYKGGFPARYEGRLSSVIDVKLKDGNMEQYHGRLNVGLATASALFEGPLAKNKSSFIASFRRSWIDGLAEALTSENDLAYRLYDANVKLNYVVDSTSRIYLSAYAGGDKFKLDILDTDLSWYNRILALRWNKVLGPRLFMNNSLTVSGFSNKISNLSDETQNEESHIGDISVESNLNYGWSPQINTSVGLRLSRDRFSGKSYMAAKLATMQSSLHLNAYIENFISLAPKWQLNAGLNYAVFSVPLRTYQSLQPRSWLRFEIDNKNSVSFAYALMTQFYHQVTSSVAALPSDFRAPSSATLKPEQATVFELGYQRKLTAGRASLQLYHKMFANLLMFDPNNEDKLFMADLLVGKGQSRGIELELEKRMGRFSGQTALTLAKTWLKFPSLNNGNKFRSPNDVALNLQTALSYKMDLQWEVTGTFYYTSGKTIAVPQTQNYNPESAEPYNYRLGDNYSVNLGAAYQKKYRSGNSGRLYFGINNLFGQPVPLFVDASLSNGELVVDETGRFKRFPYVGYSFAF